ncbi:hypothetical protein [Noviherbaspirillum sp.]|uniref:hypothetical protein n=1 Tax=Noviherbaspirillum sp. TaxID=1926288 RepID=UPI002FDF4EB7
MNIRGRQTLLAPVYEVLSVFDDCIVSNKYAVGENRTAAIGKIARWQLLAACSSSIFPSVRQLCVL